MPAGKTYEPIATQTLGSAAADVTFSSISGAYTDLVLVIVGLVDATGNVALRFNSDSSALYSTTILYGDGAAAASARVTGETSMNIGGLETAQSNVIISVMNYSNTTTFKTALGRFNRPASQLGAKVGLWRSTAAITTILVMLTSGASTFSTGTTFTLYGIKAA